MIELGNKRIIWNMLFKGNLLSSNQTSLFSICPLHWVLSVAIVATANQRHT